MWHTRAVERKSVTWLLSNLRVGHLPAGASQGYTAGSQTLPVSNKHPSIITNSSASQVESKPSQAVGSGAGTPVFDAALDSQVKPVRGPLDRRHPIMDCSKRSLPFFVILQKAARSKGTVATHGPSTGNPYASREDEGHQTTATTSRHMAEIVRFCREGRHNNVAIVHVSHFSCLTVGAQLSEVVASRSVALPHRRATASIRSPRPSGRRRPSW